MKSYRYCPAQYAVLALALCALLPQAAAQDGFPSAPVRLVLGYTPGGSADLVARLLAQKLSSQMNASVVVDNKPGASANIAAEFVVAARPDGHTLLFNTNDIIFRRAFGEALNYDVFKDLAPVSLLASSPQLLFVHPEVPSNTPAEFIAQLKANPGKLAYGSSGTGSLNHLGVLLLLQLNGLSALHVPYKGGALAINDVVGGRTQFAMQSMTAVLPLAKDKRIKVLAVAGLKRSPLLPEVPTFAETVMPGFEIGIWFAVMAPARTPSAVVSRLNSEIVKALQDRDLRSRLEQEGAQVLGTTPDEYGAYLKGELERWSKVIKTAGVKLE